MSPPEATTTAPLAFRPRSKTTRIVIHDGGPASWPTPPVTSTAHLRLRAREKGLLEVGYHYVIETDGTVHATRPRGVIGSHCPGYNHESIGVFVGGNTREGPTPEQKVSLKSLLGFLKSEYPGVLILGRSDIHRNLGRPNPTFDLEPYL